MFKILKNTIGTFSAAYGISLFTSIRLSSSATLLTPSENNESAEKIQLENWSGNHVCHPNYYYLPENLADVESIVRHHVRTKQKLRVVGSGLSPNGIGFSDDNEALINLRNCNKVINIDKEKKQVTVMSGITIEDLVEQLKPFNLTLENYASIQQQQIGGFIQIGAHGSGINIPPVDERVIDMTIYTPELGRLKLSKKNPIALYNARVGLGALGIIETVTIQCIDTHILKQESKVIKINDLQEQHSKLIDKHHHLSYYYFPYCDEAVILYSNKLNTNDYKDKLIDNKPLSNIPMIQLYNKFKKNIIHYLI